MPITPLHFGAKHLSAVPLVVHQAGQSERTITGNCLLLDSFEDVDHLKPQLRQWCQRRIAAQENTTTAYLLHSLEESEQAPVSEAFEDRIIFLDAGPQRQVLGILHLLPNQDTGGQCLAALEKAPGLSSHDFRVENILSGLLYSHLKQMPLPRDAGLYWHPIESAVEAYQRLFSKFLGHPLPLVKQHPLIPECLHGNTMMILTRPESERFVDQFEKQVLQDHKKRR